MGVSKLFRNIGEFVPKIHGEIFPEWVKPPNSKPSGMGEINRLAQGFRTPFPIYAKRLGPLTVPKVPGILQTRKWGKPRFFFCQDIFAETRPLVPSRRQQSNDPHRKGATLPNRQGARNGPVRLNHLWKIQSKKKESRKL